ncbi:MAG TPA: hypothetical protein VLF66_19745 [Thermoanaerobaculia bacterium]|nr:hypothetical protein [Thermoanaerobaculia bacterium]
MAGGSGRAERVDLPKEEAARLAERAAAVGFENLLRLLQQLLASEETVRRSDASSLAVEIAWLRAAELPRLARVEEILAGGLPRPAASRPASETPAARGVRPAPREDEDDDTPPEAPRAAAAQAPAPAEPPAPSADQAARILEWLADKKPALAGHLREAEGRRLVGGTFEIVVAPDDDLLWSRLEKPANRELLEQAVAEVVGPEAAWTRTRGHRRTEGGGQGRKKAAAPEAGDGPAAATQASPPSETDATVQAVLDIFQDTVERVEPQEEG